MRRGGNSLLNPNKKGRFPSTRKESDEDDEDYVLNEDDGDDDDDDDEYSNDSKGFLVTSDDEDELEAEEEEEADISSQGKKRKGPLPSKSSKALALFKNHPSGYDNNGKETRIRRISTKRTKVSDDAEDYDFDVPESEDDDDYEDNDAEFNPNEIDFLDEEEDLHLYNKKKNKNNNYKHQKKRKRSNNPVLHKKDCLKNQTPKTISKLLNKPIKKKHRKLLKTTPESSEDDFDVNYRATPETSSRNKRRRRNKSPVEDWDPDVACSGPSDFDYTISDEEEELLREANNFIHTGNLSILNRRLDVTGASNCLHRRPKRIQGTEEVNVSGASNYQHPRPNRRQRTLQVTIPQADTGKQVCGICFSEEGKGIVRGSLNCCSHYFCFACIMEWSKVESRCPLCKQRFVTISKPTRSYSGVDLRNMVTQVPKRDQVYQPSEEELRGYLDPYDGVVCMECQLGGDDCLMLLCDICDSPAHTYCVGLGREVPEGNWYCKGCRVSDPVPSNTQVQDLNQGTSSSSTPAALYAQRNVEDSETMTPSTVSASEVINEIGVHLSPTYSVADEVHIASPSGLGVSTLSGRRRIHRQIHNLISNNRMSQRIEMATHTDEGNVESEVVAESEFEQIGKPNTQHETSSSFNPSSVPESEYSSTWLSHLWRPSSNANSPPSSGQVHGELEQRNSYFGCQQLDNAEFEQRNSVMAAQQLLHCSSSAYRQADDNSSPQQRTDCINVQGEGTR